MEPRSERGIDEERGPTRRCRPGIFEARSAQNRREIARSRTRWGRDGRDADIRAHLTAPSRGELGQRRRRKRKVRETRQTRQARQRCYFFGAAGALFAPAAAAEPPPLLYA